MEAGGNFQTARRNFVFRSGDYSARHQGIVEYAHYFPAAGGAAFSGVAIAAEVGSGMKARETILCRIAVIAAALFAFAPFCARTAHAAPYFLTVSGPGGEAEYQHHFSALA